MDEVAPSSADGDDKEQRHSLAGFARQSRRSPFQWLVKSREVVYEV